jgi:Copine
LRLLIEPYNQQLPAFRYLASYQVMSDHATEETSVHLELRIHATGLPRSGIRSLPSCWTQVDLLEGPITATVNRKLWGSTEIVPNSSHPQWTKTLPLKYQYGSEVYFYVSVYSKTDKQGVMIGGALFEVSDVLGTSTKAKRLPKGGCVFCTLKPIRSQGDSILKCRFQALALKTNSILWGLDTYLEVAKKENNSTGTAWVTIYRSPPVFGSTSPTFDPTQFFKIDWDISLRLSIWLYKENKLLGTCETTWKFLFKACKRREGAKEESSKDLILGKPGSNRAEVGKLRVLDAETLRHDDDSEVFTRRGCDNFESKEDPSETMPASRTSRRGHTRDREINTGSPQKSFHNYINRGGQLDMIVAIDFTSSNGDPRHPESLHYQTPNSLNDYQEVISTVGDAIASNSTSKQFPVFGFGAKFGGIVRHIFQCGPSSEVHGVDGILQAYQSVFQTDIIMSGPTVLDQVIQAAAVRANKMRQTHSDSRYCVLLIITDGIVTDMQATKRKLEVYSNLPLSVIIAGVGRADFAIMHSLESSGAGVRRNVTVVKFRQHQHDPSSFVKTALASLPEQIVEYFQSFEDR